MNEKNASRPGTVWKVLESNLRKLREGQATCAIASISALSDLQCFIRLSASPQAAIGGFHLFSALAQARLGNLLAAHCTRFEAVLRFRERAGMQREHAVIGTRFEAGSGIVPGNINR